MTEGVVVVVEELDTPVVEELDTPVVEVAEPGEVVVVVDPVVVVVLDPEVVVVDGGFVVVVVVVPTGASEMPPWSLLDPTTEASGLPAISSMTVTAPRPRAKTPTTAPTMTGQRTRPLPRPG